MLRIFAAMLLLLGSFELTYAIDSEDCDQDKDLDRQIQGCTSFINRAGGNKERLASAYTNRGNAYSDKGDLTRALRDYNEAIRIDPEHPFAYYNRGLFYGHHGDNDRAIADYSTAIRLKPDFGDAYKSRAIAYMQSSRPAEGAEDWVKAVELGVNPADPRAQTPFARSAAQPQYLGEVQASADDLAKALARYGIADTDVRGDRIRQIYQIMLNQIARPMKFSFNEKPALWYELQTYNCLIKNVDTLGELYEQKKKTREQVLFSGFGVCLERASDNKH